MGERDLTAHGGEGLDSSCGEGLDSSWGEGLDRQLIGGGGVVTAE